MKCHCEAFFAEAIPLFNGDCFVASLLAMTLIFKRPHHPENNRLFDAAKPPQEGEHLLFDGIDDLKVCSR
jgi:hypothetical protein